jgi:hypothetical protein
VGRLAQLAARMLSMHEVAGSIPAMSTFGSACCYIASMTDTLYCVNKKGRSFDRILSEKIFDNSSRFDSGNVHFWFS